MQLFNDRIRPVFSHRRRKQKAFYVKRGILLEASFLKNAKMFHTEILIWQVVLNFPTPTLQLNIEDGTFK